MKRNRWRRINDTKNSDCGSARLCDLDFTNFTTDNFFEPVYIHVHRKSDDTYHRVFPKLKNVNGLALVDGEPCWALLVKLPPLKGKDNESK